MSNGNNDDDDDNDDQLCYLEDALRKLVVKNLSFQKGHLVELL